jgi:hypothetical protein
LNAGQTPAYKLTVRSATRVLPYPIGNDFDFVLPTGANPSAIMLGPGGKVSHISEAEKVYSAAELREFQQIGSESRLYTYGSVEYTDAFQIPRFSNFCYLLEWTNVHTTSHTVSCQATEQHNDAT